LVIRGAFGFCDNQLNKIKMEIKNNSTDMSTFKQIRKTIEFHSSISEENKKGFDYFRLDRLDASLYFSFHKKWKMKIINYFEQLKKGRMKIVHIDICGRTNANSLGVEESYCFSLKASDITKCLAPKSQFFFDGDIFNSKNFSDFIEVVRNKKPALVTFVPVAGLQTYRISQNMIGVPLYRKITYFRLIKRLCALIDILQPGGYIYLERPFQMDVDDIRDFFLRKPQSENIFYVALKKIARKNKCKIEMNLILGCPSFLLQKAHT